MRGCWHDSGKHNLIHSDGTRTDTRWVGQRRLGEGWVRVMVERVGVQEGNSVVPSFSWIHPHTTLDVVTLPKLKTLNGFSWPQDRVCFFNWQIRLCRQGWHDLMLCFHCLIIHHFQASNPCSHFALGPEYYPFYI